MYRFPFYTEAKLENDTSDPCNDQRLNLCPEYKTCATNKSEPFCVDPCYSYKNDEEGILITLYDCDISSQDCLLNSDLQGECRSVKLVSWNSSLLSQVGYRFNIPRDIQKNNSNCILSLSLLSWPDRLADCY